MSQFVVIKDYPDYKVNRLGEVISVYTHNDKGRYLRKNNTTLKHNITELGYASVALYKNGVLKRLSVHRLVAIAFIPNPENKPEVNHKDGNPSNNHIDNLEWVTKKENAQHSYKVLGKKGTRCVKIKNTITGEVFESIKIAAAKIGMKPTTLRAKLYGQNTNNTIFVYA